MINNILNSLTKSKASTKVLDTSILVDGRIVGLIKSGFVEGTFIVPKFVLDELQHLSDATKKFTREKGRKGFKILEELQELEHLCSVEVVEKESKRCQKEHRVDSKLVVFCKENNYKMVTVDFNLTKVARIQGVSVLNLNDLLNSLRQRVFVGEIMWVKLKSQGEKKNQGVGYLEDGTAVIVDNGFFYVGNIKQVCVRSILQRDSGRLIFAKLVKEGELEEN